MNSSHINRLAIKSLFAAGAAVLLVGGTALSASAQQYGYGPDSSAPQPPQGGPGGGGGGGGFGGGGGYGGGGYGGGGGRGFGGQGGPGGMMGNRAPSAANLSLRVMATYLALTESQISKIALSRDDMQQANTMPPPRRGGQGGQGGGQGSQPDFQAMFAEMNAKRQAAEKKTVAEIKAVLTADQVSKLALLLKAMESLQTAGIRGDAIGKLQLTDTQLSSIARGGDVTTILTPEQTTIAQDFRIPQGGPGGPGGRGGFGGPGQGGPGGRGGGPGQGGPGGDGQGAPPPPPQES